MNFLVRSGTRFTCLSVSHTVVEVARVGEFRPESSGSRREDRPTMSLFPLFKMGAPFCERKSLRQCDECLRRQRVFAANGIHDANSIHEAKSLHHICTPDSTLRGPSDRVG